MTENLYHLIDEYVANMNYSDQETVQEDIDNYNHWDKADCSEIGLLRMLLIKEIKAKIATCGPYYHGEYDMILDSLRNEYNILKELKNET